MKLFIFPSPSDAVCTLTSDDGYVLLGKHDVHSTGRPGQSFELPTLAPDGHGALLTISHDGKVPLNQRGILFLESSLVKPDAMLTADDFHLVNEKICPPPIPVPVPPNPTPTPPDSHDPLSIILATQEKNKFDLSTKEGCGQLVEESCENLHIINSDKWGHVKKTGAQNNYNGHAVDAMQLLKDSETTKAGIYDIIFSSESSEARIVFNRAGDPNPALWYYPA